MKFLEGIGTLEIKAGKIVCEADLVMAGEWLAQKAGEAASKTETKVDDTAVAALKVLLAIGKSVLDGIEAKAAAEAVEAQV